MMGMAVSAILWAPGIDLNTVRKAAATALEALADAEWGYEGSFESRPDPRTTYSGIYRRLRAERCMLEFWHEAPGKDGGPIRSEERRGFLPKESWIFKRRTGDPGPSLEIVRPHGVGGCAVEGSYERVFMLPALHNCAGEAEAKKLFASEAQPEGLEHLTFGEGGGKGWSDEYWIDLARGCSVMRYEVRNEGKLCQRVSEVKLLDFSVGGKQVWMVASARFEDFIGPPDLEHTERMDIRERPTILQYCQLTAHAFRSPAGLMPASFEPPLQERDLAVNDQVGKRSRRRPQGLVSAQDREATIAKEMDRLQQEGRLGRAVPPRWEAWRILPLTVGGVLLGAAAVFAWRRRQS